MRRFTSSTILVLCMMVLLAAAGTNTGYSGVAEYGVSSDADAAAEREFEIQQVAEDIDIMAKIIDKALEEKFPDEYKAPFFFRASRGSQGIYLKGYGAVFMTSISFPVAERKTSQEGAPPDDLWQRTKYELRGVYGTGGSYLVNYSSDGGGFDPEKVDQLKEELLRLIGTYAPNIRQLGTQENFVIAVRGTPELISFSKSPSIALPSLEIKKLKEESERLKGEAEKLKGIEMEKLKEQMEKLNKDIEKLKGELGSVPSSSGVAVVTKSVGNDVTSYELRKTTKPAPPATGTRMQEIFVTASSDRNATSRTMLIIKVSRESIAAYKDGRLDFDGYMKQAEITQY